MNEPKNEPGAAHKFTRYDSATARHYADRKPTPNVPIDTRALPVDAYAEGERFAGGEIPLGKLGGAEQIGLNITIVPPRRQSAPFHYHLFEEEHFYVLRGRAVLRTSEGDTRCRREATSVFRPAPASRIASRTRTIER